MHIIETSQLQHSFFRGEPIIKNLSLQVPERSIYGFLGPNGAGKTTTLRLILGLLRKQKGEISIFQKPLEQNRIEILRNIGSLIESPSVYEHLTAFENLQLLQKVYQCPIGRINTVLELVGLENTGSKKAKQFSLGMKQRLAIAIALLHNPKLLILDEPTNGLDPNGIVEMRELLKKINQTLGITILISSHLLAEIEKLVTHVGIINSGQLLFQGTLDELMRKRQQLSAVSIDTNDNAKTISFLDANQFNVKIMDDKILMAIASREEIASINKLLVDQGIEVYELSAGQSDLESVFMNLINQ